MGKIQTILQWILVCLVAIAFIKFGNNVTEYKESLESELGIAAKLLDQYEDRIELLEEDMFYLKGDVSDDGRGIRINNYGLSDLWFSVNYDEEDIANMKQFEADNDRFFSECIHYAELKDVTIRRNYWDNNEPVKARYLVVSYDIGEIVYDKNGTINCYDWSEESLPIDCNSLCRIEEEEEMIEEEVGGDEL